MDELKIFVPENKEFSGIESEEKSAERISEAKEQLIEYGERHKLQGLEGRIQRGLDPAGMLAIKETRSKIEQLAQNLGVDLEAVEKLTNELHIGAIWNNASALAKGEDAVIRLWTMLAEITNSEKKVEGDLSEEEFIADMERVENLLDKGMNNIDEFLKQARENLIASSKKKFEVIDGVAVSDLNGGFLAVAVNGFKSGIVKDKNGLLFVGANKLDFESLGLKKAEREDRGRMTTFYRNEIGEDVVKKLYDGFGIILNGDMAMANKLAKTAIK